MQSLKSGHRGKKTLAAVVLANVVLVLVLIYWAGLSPSEAISTSAAFTGFYLALKLEGLLHGVKAQTGSIAESSARVEDTSRKIAEVTSKAADTSREIAEATANVAVTSKEIAEATSTKFVAVFPENVDALHQLIEATTKSLVVLTDVAGYAHYSAPAAFLRYRQSLEKLASRPASGPAGRPKVKLIVYGDNAAKEALRVQLGVMNAGDWKDFVKRHKNGSYAEIYREKMRKALESPDAFIEMIEHNERDTRRLLLSSSIQVGRTERHMPFYIWISDDRTAIISFIARNPDALEYSFQTKDLKLIGALQQVVADLIEGTEVTWEIP